MKQFAWVLIEFVDDQTPELLCASIEDTDVAEHPTEASWACEYCTDLCSLFTLDMCTSVGTENYCIDYCLCVCVCCHPICSGRLACGGTSRGHTGFLLLPSAVLALISLARRIKPFLSLVEREVEFCVS